jgi:hypothetical protein
MRASNIGVASWIASSEMEKARGKVADKRGLGTLGKLAGIFIP